MPETMEDRMVAAAIVKELGGLAFFEELRAKSLTLLERGVVIPLEGLGARHLSGEKGAIPQEVTHVEIRLNRMDLYDLALKQATPGGAKEVAAFQNVFRDRLCKLFHASTGLAPKKAKTARKDKAAQTGAAP
jgi:hypothetical protein